MSKHSMNQSELVRTISALRTVVRTMEMGHRMFPDHVDRHMRIQLDSVRLELADVRTCYYASSPVFAGSYLPKAEADVRRYSGAQQDVINHGF